MLDQKEAERMKPEREMCPECDERPLMQGERLCTMCQIRLYNDGDLEPEGF